MTALKRTLTATLATVFLTGCWGEDWTAVTYYIAGRPDAFEVIGSYGSLDDCIDASRKWIADKGRPGVSTYRCGLNCEGEIVRGSLENCEASSS